MFSYKTMISINKRIWSNRRRGPTFLFALILILTLLLRGHLPPKTLYPFEFDTTVVQINRRGDAFRGMLDIDSYMLQEKEHKTKRKNPQLLLVPFKINVSRSRSLTFENENITDRWSMLTIVKSKFENHDRRNTIRQTWGSIKYLDGARLETVFVLGSTVNEIQQREIVKENQLFGDILQVNITDSYKNITMKTLAGMKWAADNIPSHWLYSSADDDIILHPANFARYIDNTIISAAQSPAVSFSKGIVNLEVPKIADLPIMCVYGFKASDPPARKPSSKWFISEEEYSAKKWPVYCRGGWYSMPIVTVSKLYEISRDVPYLFMDDVWITGLLRIEMINKFNALKHPGMILEQEGILPAPLSERSNDELELNFNEEDLDKMLVSHAGADFRSDIPSWLKKEWEKWEKSVLEKMKFFVRV